MLQSITDHNITCKCDGCGKIFTIKNADVETLKKKNIFSETLLSIYNQSRCDVCAEKLKKEMAEKRERERLAELAESLKDREKEAGFPGRFSCLEKPFIREAAVFFYRHMNDNVIVSGKTGTGKTSSALFVLGRMMKQDYVRVRYFTRQSLFAAYARAKTSREDSEEAFLDRLGCYDYIVVDELVGKKGDSALSESAQELFFNLLDGAYSEARKAKVWIFGNFYRGAIDRLVSDPEPYKRRIKEVFRPALFSLNAAGDDVTVKEDIVIR